MSVFSNVEYILNVTISFTIFPFSKLDLLFNEIVTVNIKYQLLIMFNVLLGWMLYDLSLTGTE